MKSVLKTYPMNKDSVLKLFFSERWVKRDERYEYNCFDFSVTFTEALSFYAFLIEANHVIGSNVYWKIAHAVYGEDAEIRQSGGSIDNIFDYLDEELSGICHIDAGTISIFQLGEEVMYVWEQGFVTYTATTSPLLAAKLRDYNDLLAEYASGAWN